jgi:hypothetical protein
MPALLHLLAAPFAVRIPKTEILFTRDFYVTGGTLRPDAPSYIERQADKELCQGLLNGEFCYVLTSRQMGKSSLMVRTVKRLREEGVAVAVLDLTAIGQNLTVEQWYDGLVSRLGHQLKLEDELLAFWEAHPELGPLQRWTSALEHVVLKVISSEVVIFVDEIDIVRSLPFSTDEFFAAIRECHNRRAHEPSFNRLAFGLLGVAAPTDLIRDTRMTPFNIGRRIELNDFAPQEALPLAAGLCGDAEIAQQLLARVLYWTGGHPYLTQRLCRALADTLHAAGAEGADSMAAAPPVLPTTRDVDLLAEKLFLSRQARERDDNLIFVRERILRSEVDVAGLLLLYRKVYHGELVADDETNPQVSILHLSGIARSVNGFLQVRNRIYREVFDLAWIQTNRPQEEVRRQKKAGRRGMILGFGSAAILLLGYLFLVPLYTRYHEASLALETARRIEQAYRDFGSYRDTFETRLELGVGGNAIPINGSGSLVFEAPDRVSLAVKSGLNSPETEVQLLKAGPRGLFYAPSLNQFQTLRPDHERSLFAAPQALIEMVGPIGVLPLYRLFLDRPPTQRLLPETRNIQPQGYEEIDGQRARIISWEHAAKPFLDHLGLDMQVSPDAVIPLTAWVNTTNGLVLRLKVDLSSWAQPLVGAPSELPITGLTITEVHHAIQIHRARGGPPRRGGFELPAGAQRVDKLQWPPLNFARLNSPQREFARLLPPRLSYVPSNLIDLSAYFNAALAQTWHPGTENNNLDALPTGLLQLGGTAFDVRGIVQLAGKRLQNSGARYPQQISGIQIGQLCRQLHFLHGAGWSTRDGTPVGSYLVHYADGTETTIPIVYGQDVRDWNATGDPSSKLTRSSIVWRAQNDAHFSVRLFKSTWLNPQPDNPIATVDYTSALSDSAPFLLALTVER